MKRLFLTILSILAVISIVAVLALAVSPAAPAAMAAPPAPTLSSPERGRQLDTPNVQFQWSNVNASSYHIVVFEIGSPDVIIQEATTPNTSITFRLLDDTYGWNVQATDAGGAVGPASETWYFQVLLLDTAPPEVGVTSPNGGEEVMGGSVFTITWAAIDDLTSIPNLKINIDLSTNDGASWQSIAQQESNDSAFAWQVPNINTTQALIKVTAIDERGKKGFDESDTVFRITAMPAGPTALELTAMPPNQVSLRWTHDGTNISGFRLERSRDNFVSINATFTAAANARTFADTTVPAAATLFYRVLAVNGARSSTPSNVASVIVPATELPDDGVEAVAEGLATGDRGESGKDGGSTAPVASVGLSGLTGDRELKIDNSGKSQNDCKLTDSDGKATLFIKAGTSLKNGSGGTRNDTSGATAKQVGLGQRTRTERRHLRPADNFDNALRPGEFTF